MLIVIQPLAAALLLSMRTWSSCTGFGDDDFVVLGFPCNQFGFQEPGSAGDIASFCEKNYGVSFQMMEKVDVKGSDAHPVYQWLCDKARNGVEDHKVAWNFHKFLVDEEGRLWLRCAAVSVRSTTSSWISQSDKNPPVRMGFGVL